MNKTMKATCLIALLAAPSLSAQERQDWDQLDEVDFRYGDNCEKLEELSYDGLLMLMVGADDRSRERFCSLSYPKDCDDFLWVVEEFGTLGASRKEGYCRFAPRPSLREAPPPTLRNHG